MHSASPGATPSRDQCSSARGSRVIRCGYRNTPRGSTQKFPLSSSCCSGFFRCAHMVPNVALSAPSIHLSSDVSFIFDIVVRAPTGCVPICSGAMTRVDGLVQPAAYVGQTHLAGFFHRIELDQYPSPRPLPLSLPLCLGSISSAAHYALAFTQCKPDPNVSNPPSAASTDVIESQQVAVRHNLAASTGYTSNASSKPPPCGFMHLQ